MPGPRHLLSALAESELSATHFGLALHLHNNPLRRNFSLLENVGVREWDGLSSRVVQALWREFKRNETGDARSHGAVR